MSAIFSYTMLEYTQVALGLSHHQDLRGLKYTTHLDWYVDDNKSMSCIVKCIMQGGLLDCEQHIRIAVSLALWWMHTY